MKETICSILLLKPFMHCPHNDSAMNPHGDINNLLVSSFKSDPLSESLLSLREFRTWIKFDYR